jgi:hypothetical protein
MTVTNPCFIRDEPGDPRGRRGCPMSTGIILVTTGPPGT